MTYFILGGVILLQLFWIPTPFRDIGRCRLSSWDIFKSQLYAIFGLFGYLSILFVDGSGGYLDPSIALRIYFRPDDYV